MATVLKDLLTKLPIFLFVSVFLQGCSTTNISNAFDDLVNETRHTDAGLVDFRSFMSISGLIPQAAPGSVFHNPGTLSPTHGIGISPNTSYVVETTYDLDSSVKHSDIISLRNKYISARDALLELTALRIKYSIARLASQNLANTDNCTLALETLNLSPDLECDNNGALIRQNLALLLAQVETAQANAASMKNELLSEASISNLIVTQWSSERNLTFFGEISDIFNLNTISETQNSGILIAGGFRLKTLHVGKDYACMISYLEPIERDLLEVSGIDLFQIQTKYLAYVNDESVNSAIASRLSISADQLKNYKELLDSEIQAEFDAYAALAREISNIGNLSASSVQTKERLFWPATRNQIAAINELNEEAPYQTIYTIRGQVKKLDQIESLSNTIFIDNDDYTSEDIEPFICPPKPNT